MTRSFLLCSCVSFVLLAACTGNDEVVPQFDAHPADGGDIDASDVDGGPTTACDCFVVGADPQNGVGTAAVVHLPSLAVEQNLVAGGVSSDPVVRATGSGLYVINRFGINNITIVNPTTFALVDQFSTGAGSNPQDVAEVAPGKLYVAVLGAPAIQIWDLADTSEPADTIPLPVTGADVDDNPDAASIAVIGDRAYVTLQHLESFIPSDVGQVVIIDTTTDQVVDTVNLTHMNPSSFLRAAGGGSYLLVGLTPDYSDTTAGCVEKIVPGVPTTASCLVTAATLGGLVNGIAERGDDSTELFVTSGDFVTGSLHRVNSATGALIGQPLSSASQVPVDLTACQGWVIAADGAAGGIRVWDAETGSELTTSALDIGLPPAFANGMACFDRSN